MHAVPQPCRTRGTRTSLLRAVRTCGTGRLAPGGHHCTYAVRVQPWAYRGTPGGTEADRAFYALEPSDPTTPPEPFRSTLTAKHVDAIGGFAQAVGFDVCFTLNAGRGARGAGGEWESGEVRHHVENSAQQGSARVAPSRLHQRQRVPGPAPRCGQPRPISLLGRAGISAFFPT